MKLNPLNPRNFINPLLSRKSADKAQFESFKQHFEAYQLKLAEQLNTKQTEPNIVTNVVKPFFESLAYQAENYSQKGQISIDLAIMQGITPLVLIEAKLPNSHDMITAGNLNKKAFHQAILYFMNERAKDNKSLFHIIVTDFNNWFVFDAKDFDRLFWRNKAIKKHHEALTNQSLLGDRTDDFYRDIEKVLPTLQKDLIDPETIDCAHFNVLQKHSEKELTAIYKLLSPHCLLKTFNPNDANSLNKAFYDELLYILGLEESKKDGKKVIGQSKNKQSGTLFENISNKLGQYQKPNDFESVIKLIIIWVNRILFLKLLESQIVKWSGASKFLDHHTLTQYDQLEALFFEVLAKPLSQRTIQEFKQVPYLNSSLFEIHADEKTGITIATLADDIEIDYYAKTVLLGGKTRKAGKVSTLPYLLAFLDAYDFANDSDEELTNHNKTLINASVLGLIFEKINGYKDGSFYTPSFITMYMARETIEKSVIQKFNQAKGWQCKTLLDLINKDFDNKEKVDEANTLINSIKVCDPAVGSGHFLVSALNELLRIKSELGVLVDEAGKRIKDYKLSIENDELIVMSDEGEQFEYKKGNDEKTRIQKTLFKEKQTLIENCLFGVDINPNSVNICRLRLWIELLKNAYYKPNGELDTLPNIDINIKCGNSLISRFGLTDEIKDKNIKNEIQEYKAKVTQYKNNEGSKQQVLQAIDAIKAKFQTSLKSGHQTTQKLNTALVQFVSKFGLDGLSSHQKLKAIDDLKLLGKQDSLFGDAIDQAEKNKQHKAVENAWLAVEEIESGKVYQNAFEWRFEFPEVLNEQGEFVGFDVVIGNPPYMRVQEIEKTQPIEKTHYEKTYQSAKGSFELANLFFELAVNVSNPLANNAYIFPHKFLNADSGTAFRTYLTQGKYIDKLAHFGANMVFDSADTYTCIAQFSQQTNEGFYFQRFPFKSEFAELISESDSYQFLSYQSIEKAGTLYGANNWILFDNEVGFRAFEKIYEQKGSIETKFDIFVGLQTSKDEIYVLEVISEQINTFKVKVPLDDRVFDVEKRFFKPFLMGKEVQRYENLTPKSVVFFPYQLDKQLEIIGLEELKKDFPLTYSYLNLYEKEFKARESGKAAKMNHWYGYIYPKNLNKFEQPKLSSMEICSSKPNVTVNFDNLYSSTTVYSWVKKQTITEDYKYFLAIANSSLMWWFLKNTGDTLQGDARRFKTNYLTPFPLPESASAEVQAPFIKKVDEVMLAKQVGKEAAELEAEIDALVYDLYGLTQEEIAIVEGKVQSNA